MNENKLPHPKSPEGKRLYRGRRAVAGLIGAASLASGALFVDSVADNLNGPDVPPLTQPYTVKPGDTLFGIARESLGENVEVRGLVDELADQPAYEDGLLQPGEQLLIPASEGNGVATVKGGPEPGTPEFGPDPNIPNKGGGNT